MLLELLMSSTVKSMSDSDSWKRSINNLVLITVVAVLIYQHDKLKNTYKINDKFVSYIPCI